MINWLYTLPNVGVALLFGLVGAVSFAATPFLREKLWRNRMRSDHSDAASSAFSVVIGFTGLVLAFSLVQAQGNFRNLEMQVSAEAHDLAQLDRLLVRYGDQNVAAIRAPLHEYANSILTDEWPQLRKGRSSERTAALFRPVSTGHPGHRTAGGTPDIDLCGDSQKNR